MQAGDQCVGSRESSVVARPIRAVLAVLALLPMLLAACSHPAAPTTGSATVRLADCLGNPQVRPDVITVVCANNSITARDLRWSAWGKPVAVALGTAVVDICAYEDCHTGSYRSYPMVVVASGLLPCSTGMKAYARIQYVFVGRSPFQGVPAVPKFPGFWWGASRPGPGYQVVPRPCR